MSCYADLFHEGQRVKMTSNTDSYGGTVVYMNDDTIKVKSDEGRMYVYDIDDNGNVWPEGDNFFNLVPNPDETVTMEAEPKEPPLNVSQFRLNQRVIIGGISKGTITSISNEQIIVTQDNGGQYYYDLDKNGNMIPLGEYGCSLEADEEEPDTRANIVVTVDSGHVTFATDSPELLDKLFNVTILDRDNYKFNNDYSLEDLAEKDKKEEIIAAVEAASSYATYY